jgi:hypothetical protein
MPAAPDNPFAVGCTSNAGHVLRHGVGMPDGGFSADPAAISLALAVAAVLSARGHMSPNRGDYRRAGGSGDIDRGDER